MTRNLTGVAVAVEQSTSNTSMVASSAEEMTATINEIAHNAQRAHSIFSGGRAAGREHFGEDGRPGRGSGHRQGDRGHHRNQRTNKSVGPQRNHRGGQGRRRRVCGRANEIKELAKQTALATQDIKKQIEEVQDTTSETVKEINQISEVINSVNEIVASISTAVGEQSAATQEIAVNIAQASRGMEQMSESVGQEFRRRHFGSPSTSPRSILLPPRYRRAAVRLS